ncbi:MAG: NAD(P)H-dependent glycerol-3-phosphate dehydrogenase [Pseudomonadota bacterium]
MPDSTNHSLLPIAVLGAGAWGTALALHLARNGQHVKLWAYEKEQVEQINKTRCNSRYLPNQVLPSSIVCSHDYQEVLSEVRDILIVVPSSVFRTTLQAIKSLLTANQRLLWATKGLDDEKHQLLHEVTGEVLGEIDTAVLSGPSFAKEVAMGLPTAVTIASKQSEFASALLQRFQSKNFRVEITTDMVGVELGGAIKNVLAIAVGIAEGLGFGANAKAALITRGLAEMTELGIALGAEQATFLGLSGLGDLVLTCTDNQSRNRRLGLALGQGQTLEEAKKALGTTEGTVTAKNIFYLLGKYKINAPICEAVYHVLYEQKLPNFLFDTVFNC